MTSEVYVDCHQEWKSLLVFIERMRISWSTLSESTSSNKQRSSVVLIPEESFWIFVVEKSPVKRWSEVRSHERLEFFLGENELAVIIGALALRSRNIHSASATDILAAASVDQHTLVFPSVNETHSSADQNAAAIAIGLRHESSLRVDAVRGEEEVVAEPPEPNLSLCPHFIGYEVHEILVVSRGFFVIHRSRHSFPKHPSGGRPSEKGGKSAGDPPAENPRGIRQFDVTFGEELKRLLQVVFLAEKHMSVHDERDVERRVDIVQHARLELRRRRSENIRGVDGHDDIKQLEEFHGQVAVGHERHLRLHESKKRFAHAARDSSGDE